MKLDLANRVLLTITLIALGLCLLHARPRPPRVERIELSGLDPEETSRIHLRDGVTQLKVVRPSQATDLERPGLEEMKAPWVVVAPGEARGPANLDVVHGMLRAWRDPVPSVARAFPYGSLEDMARLGFDRPDTILLNVERRPDDELLSLEVGKTTRGGRYLREEGLGDVYVARFPGAEYLTTDPTLWRDRSAHTPEALATARFGVSGRYGTYGFVREERGWHMEEGDVPLSQEAIEHLLGDLAILHTWGADNDGGEDWPASVPYSIGAWVEDQDGARVEYEIIPTSIEGGPRYRTPAQVPRMLPGRVFANLDRDPGCRDVRLLSGDAGGPIAYRFSRDGQTATLSRDEEGFWRYEGPLEAGAGTVANAIGVLMDLRPDARRDRPAEREAVGLRIERLAEGESETVLIAPTIDDRDGMHAVSALGRTWSLRTEAARRLLAMVPGPPPPEPP
jgi:hypothetical protein